MRNNDALAFRSILIRTVIAYGLEELNNGFSSAKMQPEMQRFTQKKLCFRANLNGEEREKIKAA